MAEAEEQREEEDQAGQVPREDEELRAAKKSPIQSKSRLELQLTISQFYGLL